MTVAEDNETLVKIKDDPPTPPEFQWTEMSRALLQMILGNIMLVGGVLSIIYYCAFFMVATGIWVGMTVLATGVIGVVDSARSNQRLRYSYVAMLSTSMCFSLILLMIHTWAYMFDRSYAMVVVHEYDLGQVVNGTTGRANVTAPYSSGVNYPYTTNIVPVTATAIPWPGSTECVPIDVGLVACAVLEFLTGVVCVYYSALITWKVKQAKAEPIPYKQMA